ncbi:hypothetical protein [Kutzneria buriramensis]|uniref:hypothetical protein n=1 Tax=Kutzneria buriramensis TaxID=1045776 RepID=UPI000E2884D8|nr:hypothetical protein [Kutzneria buriramensis]
MLAALLIAHLCSATEQRAAGIAVLLAAVTPTLTITSADLYLTPFPPSPSAGVQRPAEPACTRPTSAPRC